MNERNTGRWLAVPAGGDAIRLLPMDGSGPDFFVKASDYDALRAEVERLAREVSDYRDYFDASEPDTRRWPSGNARTETLRQARAAIMSRRIDRNRDADPTDESRDAV